MTGDDDTVRQELLALERQGWDSLCAGEGAGYYGHLMTPEAVMVLAHGFVLDRDAVIASLDDAPPWREYAISDERVVTVDETTAVLVYTARASRDDGRPPFRALMSTLYTRVDGEWRIGLYQQTPVPEG